MSVKIALVRRPSSRLAEGLLTHRQREYVDFRLALRQWEAYVTALVDAGWDAVEVPPAEDCPDGVFVEDTMVLFRNVAVIARPGAESRRPEVVQAEKAVEALGCSINHIRAPGTLDGGDVVTVGDTVYVGRGPRTDAVAIRQLREILVPLGAQVVAVPISKAVHLNSAVTALPDGTMIGYLPLVDDPLLFDRFVPVPEESGAHVVPLGGSRLLLAADCPATVHLLRELGYEPVTVDVSEFQKLEGGVPCLSVRLRDLAG